MTADTRTEIIEHAMVLFGERGFESVTLRDISTASGLALGTIYYHFKEKQRLWEEVAEVAFKRRSQQFVGYLVKGTTQEESVRNFFKAVIAIINDTSPPNRVIRRVLLAMNNDQRTEWTKRLNAYAGPQQNGTAHFMREIAPGCDPIELSLTFYHLAWGKVILAAVEATLPSRRNGAIDIIEDLTRVGLYVIHGMQAIRGIPPGAEATLSIAQDLTDSLDRLTRRVDMLVGSMTEKTPPEVKDLKRSPRSRVRTAVGQQKSKRSPAP